MLSNAIVIFLELLVANTVCAGLVVPTLTLPKSSFFGSSFRCPFPFACASADTGAAKLNAHSSAKLRTENARTADFGRNMETPPRNGAILQKRLSPAPSSTICGL
jgi:hypothetical protein